MINSNYPKYVERTDNQVLATPAQCENSLVYLFPISASIARQQAVCDKFLNQPSVGLCDYRAFFPQVFLVFARFERLRSLQTAGAEHGFITYREAGIWIPTVHVKDAGFMPIASHLAFFPHYMFVDSVHALVSGREVQGWPKEGGELVVPLDPTLAHDFRLRTTVIDQFAPDQAARAEELISLSAIPGSAAGAGVQFWTEGRAALEAFVRLVAGKDARLALSGPGLALSVLDIPRAGLTFAFLKQFRDAARPTRACYQAGIEANVRISSFRGLGALPGSYALKIRSADSHPLVEELGLDTSTFSEIRGIHVKMDFVLEDGVELWRVP
jgi:Acetoacetate decarboxylase (ADC)